MTGLIRKATLFSVVGLVVAGVAMAGVPNEATSTVPNLIKIGGGPPAPGMGTSAVDPAAVVTYVIRDANNTPVPNASVVLNFAACTDIVLANGAGIACGPKTFTGTTDGIGQLSVGIRGVGNGGGSPRAVCNCVHVTAGGQPFSDVGAAAFDKDGVNGVGAGDLSLLIGDFVSVGEECRSDYSGNDTVGAEDLSFLINIFILGGSPAPSPAACI
jgi:hypothetical protein